jgi:hypothetical protein
MDNARRWIGRLILISAFAGTLVPISSMAQEADLVLPNVLAAKDPKLTYRLDLMNGKLAPINRDDLKVGYVYYHFCPRRNLWTWSYYQKNGRFWYAYGEGTTQEAWCFDIRASREEISKRLDEFPELARRMDQYGEKACLRLQADGRWKMVRPGIPPSIFNSETGERWEMSRDKYIGVVHIGGNHWTVRNGSYYASDTH